MTFLNLAGHTCGTSELDFGLSFNCFHRMYMVSIDQNSVVFRSIQYFGLLKYQKLKNSNHHMFGSTIENPNNLSTDHVERAHLKLTYCPKFLIFLMVVNGLVNFGSFKSLDFAQLVPNAESKIRMGSREYLTPKNLSFNICHCVILWPYSWPFVIH